MNENIRTYQEAYYFFYMKEDMKYYEIFRELLKKEYPNLTHDGEIFVKIESPLICTICEIIKKRNSMNESI